MKLVDVAGPSNPDVADVLRLVRQEDPDQLMVITVKGNDFSTRWTGLDRFTAIGLLEILKHDLISMAEQDDDEETRQ